MKTLQALALVLCLATPGFAQVSGPRSYESQTDYYERFNGEQEMQNRMSQMEYDRQYEKFHQQMRQLSGPDQPQYRYVPVAPRDPA